jgi:sigma-B regulation protein RsbU (phosphoserine phosphatase)
VVLVLLATAGVLITARELASAQSSLRQAGVSQQQALRLRTAYVDRETGARGYVISGSEPFLEPYKNGETDAALLITLLRAGAPASARSLVEKVDADTAIWSTQFAAPAVAARERNQIGDAQAFVENGKVAFDTLRHDLTDLDKVLSDVATSRRHDRDVWQRALFGVLGVTLVAIMGMLVAVWVIVRRSLLNPLRRLSANVLAIRQADLDQPIEPVGPPELYRVAQAMEALRRRLVRELAREARARSTIEAAAVLASRLGAALASDIANLPEGWEASARLLPAEGQVAGDTYSIDLIGPSRLAVVVVDIAGHGAIAAVDALSARELMRASLRSGVRPHRAIATLPETLDLGENFLTAFAAVIDTSDGTCAYVNAGHPPPLLVSESDGVEMLSPTGPLVGIVPGEWTTALCTIAPGSTLLIYTDGLTEARDGLGEFLGEDRVQAMAVEGAGGDTDDLVTSVLRAIDTFAGGEHRDDATIVALRRTAITGDENQASVTVATGADVG